MQQIYLTMNKKKLLLVLALVAIVLYLANRNKPQDQADKEPTAESTTSGAVEIAILSVNDIHSNIDLFPQFAATVDSIKKVCPHLLVFSAGDNRTGNPVNDQYDPTNYPVIALMNATGFDVSAVGNHEWDAGVAALQNDIERADFPFLCANVRVPENTRLDVKPYEIMEVQGVRIAVVGMIEVRADGFPGAHPNNLKGLVFRKAEKVLPEYQYLKNQTDAFVLLSHCGYEDDRELAQKCPWVDVIIGGHSHTLIDRPTELNGVLITQSGSHLEYATLLRLKFNEGKLVDKSAEVLNVKGSKRSQPQVKKMVDEFNDSPALNEAIATARTKFQTRDEIGCLFTDAMRELSGADFAFQNTGGLRVNYLNKGPITVKDVYTIDPFGNEVVMFEMTGAQLKKFIINSYKKNGGYPSYVSGMTCAIVDDGQNISVFVTPDKGQFSTGATYKVAMNSYMASTVRMESLDEGQSLYKTTEEAVIEFLKKHKTVDYQGVVRIR